jgi:hypothetical protein
MITQILIKEDKDFSISNNYGDVEPFNSALIAQMLNIKATIAFIDSLNGFNESLAKKKLFKIYTRKYWNNLPYTKFLIPNTVMGCLFHMYNKPKNIF